MSLMEENLLQIGMALVVSAVCAWMITKFLRWCREDDIQYPWPMHGGCGNQIAEGYKNQQARKILDATHVGVGVTIKEGGKEIQNMSKEEVLDAIVEAGELLDAQPVPEDWPMDMGEVSDGYHTFNELYEHRYILFIALMKADVGLSWRSRKHDDGSSMDGWFIAGIKFFEGWTITYHLPDRLWSLLDRNFLIATPDRAPKWDGHTSDDVLARLREYSGPGRCGGHE